MIKEIKNSLENFTQVKIGKIFITLKDGKTFEFKQNLSSIKLTEVGLVVKEHTAPSTTTFIEYNEIRSVSRQLLG